MEFRIDETVVLAQTGAKGRIVARVRADDDPRKCVPRGFPPLRMRGDIAQRDAVTYLVLPEGERELKWSKRNPIEPFIPAQSTQRGARDADVAAQARGISDGTMASLTGYRTTDEIQRVRALFVQHIIASGAAQYRSWIHAWRWFLNSEVGDRIPLLSRQERLYVYAMPGQAHHAGDIALGETEYVPHDATAFTLDEREFQSAAARENGYLVRVGYVCRYALVGLASSRFMETVMRLRDERRAA
ncbi:MAG TPA: hypothetical protein VHE37_10120 [Nevskiaceae bacterium]|nr:hypothetical protein [Nevskiaceae bacterium]